MPHFSEARHQVEDYFLHDAAITARLKSVCLIWDLQGRLRVLFQPAENQNSEQVAADINTALQVKAGAFWNPPAWAWRKKTDPGDKAVYQSAWDQARPLPGSPAHCEVRVLERHSSKEFWLDPAATEVWPLTDTSPVVLSFFSFKGGVGRTTGMLSLAVQLARAKKSVALIDLDLEAPGLLSALPPDNGVAPVGGLLDYLLEQPLGVADLTDCYYTVARKEIVGDNGAPIYVIPAGRLDETYLEKISRLDYSHLHTLVQNGGTASPLEALIKQVRDEFGVQYILLDSRAGFHDIGGLTLSGISHLSLLFGLRTEQSWQGMELVIRQVGAERVKQGLKQLDCSMIYSMAPSPGPDRDRAVEEFLTNSYDLFGTAYYDPAGVVGEWPLPMAEEPSQPHYPIVLGFNKDVQNYSKIDYIANWLAEGDFRTFAEKVLARLGRRLG